MFRKSFRLFSENWSKFFVRDNRTEPDFYRGIKEIGDFSRFVSFLEENIYNNFAEIKNDDIVKVASSYQYFTKQAKKSQKKDTKIFNEILEILIFKVEREKSIDWNARNIHNFLVLLRQQPNQLVNFEESTLAEVLNEGLRNIDDFLLHELASFTYSVSILFPEHSQSTWETLNNKLLNQETFDFLSLNNLIQIFTGLFSLKNCENISNLTQNHKFQLFFQELLEKINKGSLHDLTNSDIFLILQNVPKEISKNLTDVLAEKLYREILNIKEFSDYSRYDYIFDIVTSIDYLQDKHYKKELFIELNNKLLLGIITKEDTIFMYHNEYLRSLYFKGFLSISKSLNFFHIPLMDHIVTTLTRDLNSKFFRQNPGILSECISCLAYLNYPGRFTAKIPHKETYWTAWQELVEKTEDFLLATIGTGYQKDLDLLYEKSYSKKNINFLWSLCVFNVHSIGILQTLLHPSSINCEENYEEEDMSKLFQVYYWLNFENNGMFELDPRLLEKMKKFKEKVDSEPRKLIQNPVLKNAIRESLIQNSINFKESHSDFPYSFDFANIDKRSAILIDDESRFLQGTNMQIRNGFSKVMNRQLVSLGWAVQKISLRNLISLNVSELLPR